VEMVEDEMLDMMFEDSVNGAVEYGPEMLLEQEWDSAYDDVLDMAHDAMVEDGDYDETDAIVDAAFEAFL